MIATTNTRFTPHQPETQNPGQAAPTGMPETPVPAGPATRKPQSNLAGGWDRVFSDKPKYPPGFWLYVLFFAGLLSFVLVKNCETNQPEPASASGEKPVAGRHPAGWDKQVEEIAKKLNASEFLTIEEQTIARQARWSIVPQLTSDHAKVLLLANESALGNYYSSVMIKDSLSMGGYTIVLVTAQFTRGTLIDGDIEVFWMQSILLLDLEKMKWKELRDWRVFWSTYPYPRDGEISGISKWMGNDKQIQISYKDGDWEIIEIPQRPFRGTGR